MPQYPGGSSRSGVHNPAPQDGREGRRRRRNHPGGGGRPGAPHQGQGQGQGKPHPGQPGAPPDFYDLSTDPILAAIQAQNAQMIANAEASAEAQRSKLLLQYGDPELARQYGGENAANAAEQNPFSILKQLQYGYQQNVGQANEGLNKANLFYSSTRGQTLGELGRALSQGQASAGQSLQDALSGLTSGVLDVKNQAGQRETDALNQAYQNALEFSLQYGIGPKTGGGKKKGPGPSGGGPKPGSGGGNKRRRRNYGPRPGGLSTMPIYGPR